MMMSLSIGEGSSYFSSVQRSSPFTTKGYSLPSSPFIRSAASSYFALQLFVVGRHGRVGDAELLCHGRVAPF